MKKENQYRIEAIYHELAAKDPDWAKVQMKAKFKTLYDGWRQKGLRHKQHSHFFYTAAWDRGWLPKHDWYSLREYVLQ